MNHHFHPAAEAEHYEIVRYYESQSPGLGGEHLDEFAQVIQRLLAHPGPLRFRLVREPDLRIAPMARFPYQLIYRVSADEVHILAVAHYRRRPDYWLERR